MRLCGLFLKSVCLVRTLWPWTNFLPFLSSSSLSVNQTGSGSPQVSVSSMSQAKLFKSRHPVSSCFIPLYFPHTTEPLSSSGFFERHLQFSVHWQCGEDWQALSPFPAQVMDSTHFPRVSLMIHSGAPSYPWNWLFRILSPHICDRNTLHMLSFSNRQNPSMAKKKMLLSHVLPSWALSLSWTIPVRLTPSHRLQLPPPFKQSCLPHNFLCSASACSFPLARLFLL